MTYNEARACDVVADVNTPPILFVRLREALQNDLESGGRTGERSNYKTSIMIFGVWFYPEEDSEKWGERDG